MGDKNKPKTFVWSAPNLSKVSYGKPFSSDVSQTVPKAKKEKWNDPVLGGKLATPAIVKGDPVTVATFDENTLANEKMRESKNREAQADRAKSVVGPQVFKLNNPMKKLERHKNINKVVVGGIAGGEAIGVGGTPQELENWGVIKSVTGKKATGGVVKPTKEDKTQKFLDKQ